jgi:hypothetical protein
MIPYEQPQLDKTAFNCPHCNAYSEQIWYGCIFALNQDQYIAMNTPSASNQTPNDQSVLLDDFRISLCYRCKKYTIWHVVIADIHSDTGIMIFPDETNIPPPNPDLPEEIKNDYLEASSIHNKSPRGAAALLRLCIEKLCKELGEKGKNLNKAIGNLVKKGLSEEVQQALDSVRVIGNEAVHPGLLDLKDNPETTEILFKIVNIIANRMISEKKEIDQVFNLLPIDKRKEIKRRDESK